MHGFGQPLAFETPHTGQELSDHQINNPAERPRACSFLKYQDAMGVLATFWPFLPRGPEGGGQTWIF